MTLGNVSAMLHPYQGQPQDLKQIEGQKNSPIRRVIIRKIGTDHHGDVVYRTELMEALYTPESYTPDGKGFSHSGKFSKRYMTKFLNAHPNDERGHLIPRVLGGPPELFNMVPQSAEVNRNSGGRDPGPNWYIKELTMTNFTKNKTGYIYHTVVPQYSNFMDARPSGFLFQAIYFNDQGKPLKDPNLTHTSYTPKN